MSTETPLQKATTAWIATVRADERECLLREMLGELPPDAYAAMLTAAGEITLERENGGLEYPPFKVFKAMLRAYAATRGITV